jgi:hypothetical protein
MRGATCLPIAAAVLLVSVVSSPAEYILVLKSDGQIIVQNYREEGAMSRFPGFGGETGLSKDQVLTLRRDEEERAYQQKVKEFTEQLIDEMKAKNFDTASLFLD